MSKGFEEEVMREVKYLQNADEIGENLIAFVAVAITEKKHGIIPTYIRMIDENACKMKMTERLQKSLEEFSESFAEAMNMPCQENSGPLVEIGKHARYIK